MSKNKTPTWGFFSDLPGYSGRITHMHHEPPVDYEDVHKKALKYQPPLSEAKNEDDADGNPKSLLRVFSRFADRTSMQGVPYINVSKHPVAKVLWTILLIAAMTAMTVHLYILFSTYYKYDKQTQVLLGFSKLSFPAVTICNMNAVRKSMLDIYGSEELEDFVDSIRPSILVKKLKEKHASGPQGGNQGSGQGKGRPGQSGGGKGRGSSGQSGGGQGQGNSGQSGGGQGQGNSGQSGGGQGQGSPGQSGGGQGQGSSGQSGGGQGQGSSGQSGGGQGQGSSGQSGGGQGQGSSGQSGGGQGQGSSGQNNPNEPSGKNRKKRFVNSVEFNFTNKRGKFKGRHEDIDEENQFFTGQRSSLHGIKDEFTYLLYQHPRNIRQKMGHQIEDMLVDCSFDGVTCGPENFRLVPSTAYGNCFTLQNDLFVVRRNGPSHGLELTLFLETQEFLRGISSGNGIVVLVHQPDTWAFPENSGFYISTYQETNVAMRLKNIKRLGFPYGHCENGIAYKQLYNITYTRQTCQSICYSSGLHDICGCYDEKDELMQRVTNFSKAHFKSCSNDTEVECQLRLEQNWESGNIKCSCPNPCGEISYRRLLSSRNWPSDKYALLLLETICNNRPEEVCEEYTKMDLRQLNLNFLKLNIFFEDLNYENVTEIPSYENSQFLSDVGGTIGLWIGLSLLSIAEVIQLVCEFLHYICYVKVKTTAQKRTKERWRSAANNTNRKRSVVESFYPQYANSLGLHKTQNTDHSLY